MASERGLYESPAKSPYSHERYDSGWESQYMDVLERDPRVRKWTKRHGIAIPWRDGAGTPRTYRPDYLVELSTGTKELHEVKGTHLMQMPDTRLKLDAGQRWCERRGMAFRLIYKD